MDGWVPVVWSLLKSICHVIQSENKLQCDTHFLPRLHQDLVF